MLWRTSLSWTRGRSRLRGRRSGRNPLPPPPPPPPPSLPSPSPPTPPPRCDLRVFFTQRPHFCESGVCAKSASFPLLTFVLLRLLLQLFCKEEKRGADVSVRAPLPVSTTHASPASAGWPLSSAPLWPPPPLCSWAANSRRAAPSLPGTSGPPLPPKEVQRQRREESQDEQRSHQSPEESSLPGRGSG